MTAEDGVASKGQESVLLVRHHLQVKSDSEVRKLRCERYELKIIKTNKA